MPWSAFVLCLILLFTAATSAHGADAERAKHVLMISTEGRFTPGVVLAEQAVQEVLLNRSPSRIEFYAEYLDDSRFAGESHHRLFYEYLRDKYSHNSPDLVILFYTRNFYFAGQLPAQLFGQVPVVAVGLSEEEIPVDHRGANFTEFAQRVDFRGTMDLIIRLQPETRRVVVIGGTAAYDRINVSRAEEAARSLAGRVEFEFWTERSMAELKQAVASLPPHTAILFTSMFRDAAGQAFVPPEVARLLASAANVPLYVLADTMVGSGALGGSVVHIEALGKRAGELAHRVLNGAPPASLPFEILTDGVPMFDWRALKRWGISERRLPPNSVIKFRPQSVWDQYRWYIIVALAIIAIQAAMITDLLLHRARRRRAEAELRESQELMEMATRHAE